MELFDNLIFGFSVAFSLQNLLYCLIGVMAVSYTHLTLPTILRV